MQAVTPGVQTFLVQQDENLRYLFPQKSELFLA